MTRVAPEIREFHDTMKRLANKDGITTTITAAGKSVTIGPDQPTSHFSTRNEDVSMETISRQPINEEFGTMLEEKDDRPGAPFFDKTLNFLQNQYNKTNSNIGNLTQKKFKIQDQISVEVRELETLRSLLIDEWRARRPVDPESGEFVDPPLGLTEEEMDR